MGAAELIPDRPTLDKLRLVAAGCRACPLWECGTQTVFGEGAADARLMLVGEQPGDQEDKQGRPFVGPAGKLLAKALAEAGIAPDDVYVTNAVKHFKWQPKGKRRIHRSPNTSEVAACRPWLEAEIALVRPNALVCLGATAARALLGRGFKVSEQRGVPVASPLAPVVSATVHPSSILRSRNAEERRVAFDAFVADLAAVAQRAKRQRVDARGRG